MADDPSNAEEHPQRCKRCGTALRRVTRRTIQRGDGSYTLEVWVCSTCHCAYGSDVHS
jgi:uncharacterized protein with PIN domain